MNFNNILDFENPDREKTLEEQAGMQPELIVYPEITIFFVKRKLSAVDVG